MPEMFRPDLSPEERKRLLENNADKVEKTEYYKPLSPEEIDLRREQHTDNAILLSDIEEEKKEAMADFKARMEPLTIQNKQLLSEVRSRHATVTGKLFTFYNTDERTATVYDENGDFISSRRMRPDENQTTIHSITKAM